MSNKINVVDTTMRDGSHSVSHSFTKEQVAAIAKGLEEASVPFIELSHGDGIAGSTFNYGFSLVDEMELLKAASSCIKNSKLLVLLLPGIGTIETLKKAIDSGANGVRVATHVTEADISHEHISAAKKMNLFTVGFLMMVHMAPPSVCAEQAKLMESYGADYINLADSAGYLLPEEVKEYVNAVKNAVKIPVGFHCHNNLGVAAANSLAAVEAGATYIDVSMRGLGAGAGNTQAEVFTAIMNRLNYKTDIDFYKYMDVAENVVEPIMKAPQVIRNASLMLGYAGVYSSFLLHTYNAAKKFNIDPRDILSELGKRRMVGGQEDMIIDVAYNLSKSK